MSATDPPVTRPATAEGGAAGGPSGGAGRRRLAGVLAFAMALVLTGLAAVRSTAGGGELCGAACHADTYDPHPARHRHPNLACEACHDADWATRVALRWRATTGQRDGGPVHGRVDDRRCLDCHQSEQAQAWGLIAATAGHRQHPVEALARPCIDCHGLDEHGLGTIEASCTGCHGADGLHATVDVPPEHASDDPDRCLACHVFVDGTDDELRTVVDECGGCHGAEDDRRPAATEQAAAVSTPEIQHGQVDCRLCHNPHGHDRQAEQGGHDCDGCHRIEAGSAELAVDGHRVCQSCHEPHGDRRDASGSCEECHAEQAKGLTPAAAGGEPGHDTCDSCHLPHLWKADRSGCTECHEDTARKLAASSPAEHGQCTDCHEPHDTSAAGAKCASADCHGNLATHAAQAPAGHRGCETCHSSHEVKTGIRDTCQGCHGAAETQMVAAGVDSHTKLGCRGCHLSHGASAARETTCASCHAEEQKLAAAAGTADHQRCNACHKAHSFSAGSMQTACSSCHRAVVETGGGHSGDCQSCHTPHGAAAVASATCVGCHSEIKTAANKSSKHGDCSSCHQAHAPAGAVISTCVDCHAPQQQSAKAWPAGSPHQAGCETCHPSHDVNAGPSCASCHGAEAAAARGDQHRCSHCHAAHEAPPADPSGYWADCKACHTAQATSSRSLGPTHAGCANCHAPHGFKSPACTSCHGEVAKLGSHAHPDHRDCSRCHEPHSRVSVKRAQCLGCHTDLKDHEPDAPRCQACHPFK